MTSVVSPKMSVLPSASSRSNTRPTVGLEARPLVVSDSPHFVDTMISSHSTGTRGNSVAYWTNPWAARAASAIVCRSPVRSMLNARTGLPVSAICSTM